MARMIWNMLPYVVFLGFSVSALPAEAQQTSVPHSLTPDT